MGKPSKYKSGSGSLYLTFFFGLVLSALTSCFDIDKEASVGLSDGTYELAVPLVNTKATVEGITDASDINSNIRIDPDGKVHVIYNGEVINGSSASIFPPFPGLEPLRMTDTVTNVEIFDPAKYQIQKAIFNDTKIYFRFENNQPQDVNIDLTIPELQRDGQGFSRSFKIDYNNSLPAKLISEQISVEGWSLVGKNNSLTFHYTATMEDGQKVRLDVAEMYFDVIRFDLITGYLGHHDFVLKGSVIDIGLFDKWKSGSFDFEDPKITISVDNAFGLPVRSRVNKMELTTITGNRVVLQSPFIDTGIDFAYPSLNEIGTVKTTYFNFDRNNSNIREVFNEKTKSIAYDISALVNADRDTTIKGFITGDSKFTIKVAVEVPLWGSVNDVVVADTLDLDLKDFDEVEAAEFKAITTNDFPADMVIQAYFLDDNKQVLDKLFDGEGYNLQAATLLPSGRTQPGAEKTSVINYDKDRFDKVKKASKLALYGRFNTTGAQNRNSLWVYSDYGIGLKMGAKIKYRKK